MVDGDERNLVIRVVGFDCIVVGFDSIVVGFDCIVVGFDFILAVVLLGIGAIMTIHVFSQAPELHSWMVPARVVSDSIDTMLDKHTTNEKVFLKAFISYCGWACICQIYI